MAPLEVLDFHDNLAYVRGCVRWPLLTVALEDARLA